MACPLPSACDRNVDAVRTVQRKSSCTWGSRKGSSSFSRSARRRRRRRLLPPSWTEAAKKRKKKETISWFCAAAASTSSSSGLDQLVLKHLDRRMILMTLQNHERSAPAVPNTRIEQSAGEAAAVARTTTTSSKFASTVVIMREWLYTIFTADNRI